MKLSAMRHQKDQHVMSVVAEYIETPFPTKHMGKEMHHISGMFSCIYVRQVCLFYVSMWMVHEPGM